jgi:hypothetical protein
VPTAVAGEAALPKTSTPGLSLDPLIKLVSVAIAESAPILPPLKTACLTCSSGLNAGITFCVFDQYLLDFEHLVYLNNLQMGRKVERLDSLVQRL